MALMDAAKKAGPVLVEPVMEVEAVTPEEYLGDVVGDLGTRRVEISDIEISGNLRVIQGRVPIAEMFQYVSALRGMTQGRASYSMEFKEFEPLPPELSAKIVG